MTGPLWHLVPALALLAAVAPGPLEPSSLREDVELLSDDALLGRETGTEGCHVAEEHIARAFREAGLSPPPGRNDYFVPYTLYRSGFDPERCSVEILTADASTRGDAGVGFNVFPFSDEGEIEAEVVFAGYGITAEAFAYDDYEGLDVEGKLVLVLRHEPGEKDPASAFDGAETTGHSLFTTKAARAADRGAVGMLLVTDPLHHDGDRSLRMNGSLELEPPEQAGDDGNDGDDGGDEVFLAVHVSRALADALLAGSGRTLEEIQRGLDDGSLLAREVDPGRHAPRARLRVTRRARPEPVAARNVAGFLEGSDPSVRDEIVVVGAHHDHIGGTEGPGDQIYNGADDNASGTAAVIGLARAFASAPAPPRRSVLFTTFSGEERGLLGSKAMVEQELIPIDDVIFMLNMDMVGRNPDDPVSVLGDGFSRGLTELVAASIDEVGIDAEMGGRTYSSRSDHDSFHRYDVPFVFLFTGIHDDYHQVGDHADKVDYEHMSRVARLAHRILGRVADAPVPPRPIHDVAWLGVEVELLAPGRNGMGTEAARAPVVTAVHEASRAADAGFQVDDIVVAFDDERLPAADWVGRRFREVAPGTRTTIRVRRGDTEHDLTVERAETGYLGVFPGEVDDDVRGAHGLLDGQGLRVQRIVGGGPADDAGLLDGDIVIELAGQSVGTGSLRSVLARIGAGETVDALVIRSGERMTLPLTLGERPRR